MTQEQKDTSGWPNRDTLLERIRKLKAKAEDASVTEAEAALYAQKVAQLLQQYNLTEAALEVEEQEEITEDRMENSWTNNPWTHEIAGGVAKLYFCELYLTRLAGSQRCKLVFVGRPHNIEVAVSMTDYLIKTVTKLALAYAKSPEAKADFHWTPVRARNGFQRGAARRLYERLLTLYKDQVDKPAQRSANGNPANLPALYQSEQELLKKYLASLKLRMGRGAGSSVSGTHAARGAAAASNISLNAQVGGSSTRMLR